jgi:hypothetical protein
LKSFLDFHSVGAIHELPLQVKTRSLTLFKQPLSDSITIAGQDVKLSIITVDRPIREYTDHKHPF